MGAIGYFETSSITGDGVRELFYAAIEAVLLEGPKSKQRKRKIIKRLGDMFLCGGSTLNREQSENSDQSDFKKLLECSEVNISDRFGNSALSKAAANGNAQECDNLLRNGANVDHKNAFGETPLTLASSLGIQEFVKSYWKQEQMLII